MEQKQLQRNINISFQRGKKSSTPTGDIKYSLEDGFSVFDKISNTPTYWKTAKHEMYAKLQNLGPFQFFFTLSAADSRWDENFSSILVNQGINVEYEFNNKGEETTWIVLDNDEKMELRKYLKERTDKSTHELIRRNVTNATRNYNHRVKAFIQNIIMNKNNPMAVKYYSTKVEFQGRGAAHNHGVLWVDLDRMEMFVENDDKIWCNIHDVLENEVT